MTDNMNRMAIDCFTALALDEIMNHYDPELDDPRYTSTIEELCEHVYNEGVNRKATAVGPRMRVLYIPDGLRFQGKEALEAHVRMGVTLALMQWNMDTNGDFSWLDGEVEGCGRRVDAWRKGMA